MISIHTLFADRKDTEHSWFQSHTQATQSVKSLSTIDLEIDIAVHVYDLQFITQTIHTEYTLFVLQGIGLNTDASAF